MAGSNNGEFFYGNPLPPECAHWPLDLYMDDDEFRAGYPFTDIPEIESNDDCESHNTSSTFDNDVVESDISDDDICMSTGKDNNQLNQTAEQKEETKDELHENHETHGIHLNQLHENHETHGIHLNQLHGNHEIHGIHSNQLHENQEIHSNQLHENQEIHLNQLNSYIREELDNNHLHQLQSQINTINGETLELSQHTHENE